MSESRTLTRENEIRAGAWRGNGGLHGEGRQIPRRKERASKESLPRTSRRNQERVNGCKSSAGRSAESFLVSLLVWPNLKWERRLGDEWPDHIMKE